MQIKHDCIKVIYICVWRDERHTLKSITATPNPRSSSFSFFSPPHTRKRRKIYTVYVGKPRWLYMVIGWRMVHSWRMWLAGGFITLCKTFQTLMCNRALLSLCCCSAPCSLLITNMLVLQLNTSPTSSSMAPAASLSLSTFICHHDIYRDRRVNTLAGPLLPQLDISSDTVWCRD